MIFLAGADVSFTAMGHVFLAKIVFVEAGMALFLAGMVCFLAGMAFFLPECFGFSPAWLFSCWNGVFLTWAHGRIFDRINYRGKKTVVLLE